MLSRKRNITVSFGIAVALSTPKPACFTLVEPRWLELREVSELRRLDSDENIPVRGSMRAAESRYRIMSDWH